MSFSAFFMQNFIYAKAKRFHVKLQIIFPQNCSFLHLLAFLIFVYFLGGVSGPYLPLCADSLFPYIGAFSVDFDKNAVFRCF